MKRASVLNKTTKPAPPQLRAFDASSGGAFVPAGRPQKKCFPEELSELFLASRRLPSSNGVCVWHCAALLQAAPRTLLEAVRCCEAYEDIFDHQNHFFLSFLPFSVTYRLPVHQLDRLRRWNAHVFNVLLPSDTCQWMGVDHKQVVDGF
jgi:hypothetical protein